MLQKCHLFSQFLFQIACVERKKRVFLQCIKADDSHVCQYYWNQYYNPLLYMTGAGMHVTDSVAFPAAGRAFFVKDTI